MRNMTLHSGAAGGGDAHVFKYNVAYGISAGGNKARKWHQARTRSAYSRAGVARRNDNGGVRKRALARHVSKRRVWHVRMAHGKNGALTLTRS